MKHIQLIETILYVNEQKASDNFYTKLFRQNTNLNVPGMTEFKLAENRKLDLMPNKGIVKKLSDTTPHPDQGNEIPRCELYFYVENIELEFDNATKIGAKLISEIEHRDWGNRVCYFSDIDGHIIAFAEKLNKK
ncbi:MULTISPECIES: VOC family protein [unclassified Empedobacter]|uniref:VOC family protein n=1 Tax=unclassified Empedobacter TaxID=2643773 RepID=UPI0025C6E527|nr:MULTISPECIES: VOC family protein [unclassified Empedobacter]